MAVDADPIENGDEGCARCGADCDEDEGLDLPDEDGTHFYWPLCPPCRKFMLDLVLANLRGFNES